MRKPRKQGSLLIFKVLELIGKPIFFLFTIIVLFCFSFVQLITKLIHQFHFPHLSFPKISLPKIPMRTLLKRNSWLQAKKGPVATGRRVLVGPLNFKLIFGVLILLLFILSTYWYVLKDLPSVRSLSDNLPSLTTKIYDRHGTLLYQIYKDENRSLIKLEDLPSHVINATLAAEDKNFYHHPGIDLVGLFRATYNNFINCKFQSQSCTLQGGSTITQQLVKNTLLTPEKTLTRKIKELILSFSAEYVYSKDEILEMYLNQIGYGGTAYGIEEASYSYFGKSAKDLSLAESSMLAGLPIAPTTLSPYGTNPYLGKIRQQQVLENMVQAKSITENEKVEALSTPLVFHGQATSIKAPHFVMYVKDLLVQKYGEGMVARGGLSVTTSLDLNIQEILNNEISVELSHLKNLKVSNGAGMVVTPGTGEILAMVGSHDFFDTLHDGQVNITLQERQPGSSIKPINYALSLSRGMSPNSLINDSPICFRSPGQPDYCPKNYDGRFHGQVTLRTALASSYNVPAVKLLNLAGVNNMVELGKLMGITTWNDPSRYGLSLTLGGGEIKMIDMVSVYSIFANGGVKVPLTSLLFVRDNTGKELLIPNQSEPVQVISPAIAYQINSILSDPQARAPAFGMGSVLNLPGKNVAVKTGTTNSLRDNWTFGYTSDLLVATWVGNNDNSPMSSVASGVTGASPIWARTMKKLLSDKPALPFNLPDSIVKINTSCEQAPKYEYFIKGNDPKIDCTQKTGNILETAVSTSQ